MRINTNVGALTASRNSFVNTMATESSMRKLSSGLRIARAGDDANGLGTANNYRSSHRKLQMGVNNAEQTNAKLQIAEGAVMTIERIRERIDELAVQGVTSGTEYDALTAEITRIVADTTQYLSGDQTVNTGSGGSITIALGSALSSSSSLDAINTALTAIGAGQNRLEFTIQNVKAAVVNVKAAESVIRDVDMAEEMANFTKNNILVQAAQAMLAQANQGTQSILQLLR
jgi:flagellin